METEKFDNNNLPSNSKNFIEQIIEEDIKNNKNGGSVHTRFPPEPNGYLHIGHAKSIILNFGLAKKYNGLCNLRFDDTNPVKEDIEYIDSIKEDIKWLGFDWEDREYYASDYFEILYEYAEKLIKKEKAYVCDLSPDEISKQRGTVTTKGIESPYRNRSIEENLDLFRRMRNGEFEEGSCVLRAKIDMSHPNMLMRDPILYRIIKTSHHRTGDKWCIYPMYDFAHGQCDSIERITHSICTLEFEVHKQLYDWFVKELEIFAPQQIEFARLNLTYTVMSKRKLLELVENKYVNGWDDPRMPTICGLRRRGYTPESIKMFSDKIGVARRDNTIDVSLLEFCVREHLNKIAERRMAVLNPLKVVITNYPDNHIEELDAVNNPEDFEKGTRKIPFSRVIYIERDDFIENPPQHFFRLSPGNEVRLRYAYFIKCTDVIKDPTTGEIKEIHCTYDPASKGGNSPDGRKVKGTIHWVSANHCIEAEIRLYDRLFLSEFPEQVEEGHNYTDYLNPDSLKIIKAFAEPSLANVDINTRFQFERIGYFTADKDTMPGKPVFNRTVTLKDSWIRKK